MQIINIIQPRWHDRKVLVAKWKIGMGMNEIRINHKSFPQPLYMSGTKIKTYPIEHIARKNQQGFDVYVIPIDDLETATENRDDILNKVKEIF